jgi:hypothetical protein
VANRPANDPVNPGTVFIATDLGEIQVDTGTVWVGIGDATPSAVVQAYMGTVAPAGWLLCDGSAVSRTTYAALFGVIGISCGQGDGSTTFNIPDLRGQFLRGVDGGVGRDPDTGARTAMNTGGNTGDNVGSVQADATGVNGLLLTDPGHQHTLPYVPLPGASSSGGVALPSYLGGVADKALSATTGITLSGDNETRPTNAYVSWIIKT